MKKSVKIFSLVFIFTFIFYGCKATVETTSKDGTISGSKINNADSYAGKNMENRKEKTDMQNGHTQILFTMENGKTFTVELYPEYAPQTCENFISLVKDHFYDGLTFHRVVEGFMAQGGDPLGNGTGGSEQTIPGEFSANGFAQNKLSHTRGVISMARSSDMNSASSQFFICYEDSCNFLDGNYAAFGKVIDGMETVDDFLKIERTYSGGELSKPTKPIVIKTAEVVA